MALIEKWDLKPAYVPASHQKKSADLSHPCDCQQFQNKAFFFFFEADQTLATGPKCPPDLTVAKRCREQASQPQPQRHHWNIYKAPGLWNGAFHSEKKKETGHVWSIYNTSHYWVLLSSLKPHSSVKELLLTSVRKLSIQGGAVWWLKAGLWFLAADYQLWKTLGKSLNLSKPQFPHL